MSLYRTSGVFKSTLLKVAAVLENFPWMGAEGGERPASDPWSRNTDADGGSCQQQDQKSPRVTSEMARQRSRGEYGSSGEDAPQA